VPLPVNDRYYADVTPTVGPPKVLFVGRSTEHRERMLAPAKELFPDLLHMAFGVGADELEELLAAHDVGVNVHNDTYLSFENRVCLHLAAGHLVISEPLSPTHGLEHGVDYVPVGDRYFQAVGAPLRGHPRLLFVGRSTPHRERVLMDVKHHHDLLHLAFGVGAGDLEQAMAEHDVGINVHNEDYPSFENRVCLHLAAGHLVLSEWLSPAHGLEAGMDFIEITGPGSLWHAVEMLGRFPGLWHRVRVRGRMKAEQFRASRVWPRLLHDAIADVGAFGSARP
jgi:hypothetical protein